MNLITVGQAGLEGLGFTLVSLIFSLSLGFLIGKILRSDTETSILITVGTAICGGSAIAAMAPVIRAKPHSITVALGTVFILNAIALLVFPILGHHFGLSQHQFGVWSALAIHDTSSVVGAGLQYGAEALQVGTTIKLARALWIVPLTLGFSWTYKDQISQQGMKPKRPWFILGFVGMAGVMTWIPVLQPAGQGIEWVARRGLVLTLFCIGAGLSRQTLKQVGWRPFLQGFTLWILVLITVLVFVKSQA
jgi:uncharacterized integral membrane protein (TIGR00698 family)